MTAPSDLPPELARLLEAPLPLAFAARQRGFASWQAAIAAAWAGALPPPDPVTAADWGAPEPIEPGLALHPLALTFASGKRTEGAALLPADSAGDWLRTLRGGYFSKVENALDFVQISPPEASDAGSGRAAILMLHDHGGEFRFGWRKLQPNAEPDAAAFAERFYGGFAALRLARAGHPVFAFDAFGWGARVVADRDQQALGWAALALGTSLQALVAAEDRDIASWLGQAGPLGAWGFSFGGFRAWQLLAVSAEVRAGVALSWMARRRALIAAGAPVTAGQSAFWMLDPGLSRLADLPDLAGAGAPKPLFLRTGDADRHLPRAAVEAAHGDLAAIWDAAGGCLDAGIFAGGHICPPEVQEAAIAFLNSPDCSR